MKKIHVYFVPGMATNSKIFEHIHLDETMYNVHFIEWKTPSSYEESIEAYAKRMCSEIMHDQPVLIGVSFGGIVVQEMSKLISTKKVIIISSIKSYSELPKRLRIAQKVKAYNYFPTKIIGNLDTYLSYFSKELFQKQIAAYNKYMSVRNSSYLKWAAKTVLLWNQEKPLPNCVHIHGTNDGIFPAKHIRNYIDIEGGTHTMILTKAKRITQEIQSVLTCLNKTK